MICKLFTIRQLFKKMCLNISCSHLFQIIGKRELPGTGGAENDGIRGVWGALPACPLVMS